MTRPRTAVSALVALCSGLLVPLVVAAPAQAASTKVSICHATNSHTNPYRRITVSQSAVNRHGTHHGAGAVWSAGISTRWDDIVPDGSAGYDGSNGSKKSWTAQGIAVYDGVTRTVAGRLACRGMSTREYYDSEIAAGVDQAAVLADLNDQAANEDAALRAALGGSFTAANVGQLTALGAATTTASPSGEQATVRGTVSLGRDVVAPTTAEQAALHFEHGTDPDLVAATRTPAAPATATGGTEAIVTTPASAAVAGLVPGTTYFYRLVAVTDAGLESQATFLGAIRSFVAGTALPPPPPAPALTSSGPVDAVQSVDAGVPEGAAVALLADGHPATSVTVDGEGTFSVSGTVLRFAPARGYTGPVTPVPLRVTDAHGQTATGTYAPVITAPPLPPAPVPVPLTSTGVGTAVQSATPELPESGTLALEGETHVPGVGTWSVVGGQLRFAPAAGFVGTPAGITYVVTDAHGQRGVATYTPTVTLPAPPAPAVLTSTGDPAVVQSAPAVLPARSTLLSSGSPVTQVVVAGQGTYALDEPTGRLTFTPVHGFTGPAAPVTYRVTDAYGQSATATYTATVRPAAPRPAPLTTVGTGTAVQRTAVPVPVGGSVSLVAGGAATTRVTVPRQGTYALDPRTGALTFTPVAGFRGTPAPVTYRVTDALGRSASATYAPRVLAAPVAVPPALVRDTPRTGLVPTPARRPREGSPVRRTTQTTRSAAGLVAPESQTLGRGALRRGQATTLPGRFLFAFDSPRLTPKGVQVVKALVPNLRGTRAIRCEGYTDYAGDHRHELVLSQQRALAVCRALRSFGAKVTTTTRGYAGTKPVVVGGHARTRHENRRVVVVVER